ncbi:hypothetical protein TcBrA4_0020320 [Trypanosoma cruzi]|nr:hypothetical protein TcBrA4_0020320 [Trypanosoma cruzi]
MTFSLIYDYLVDRDRRNQGTDNDKRNLITLFLFLQPKPDPAFYVKKWRWLLTRQRNGASVVVACWIWYANKAIYRRNPPTWMSTGRWTCGNCRCNNGSPTLDFRGHRQALGGFNPCGAICEPPGPQLPIFETQLLSQFVTDVQNRNAQLYLQVEEAYNYLLARESHISWLAAFLRVCGTPVSTRSAHLSERAAR